MPVSEENILIRPQTEWLQVAIEPVQNILHSMVLLLRTDEKPGLSDWVVQTAALMSPAERRTHNLVMIGLHYAVLPRRSWASFAAYLDHLEIMEPTTLRDRMIESYITMPCKTGRGTVTDPEIILRSERDYLAFLGERFGEDGFDPEVEAEAFSYAINPRAMRTLIVSHLRTMWDKYLRAEWQRVRPMLQDAAAAFREIDLSHMNRQEAAEFITGRKMDDEWWLTFLNEAERVTFVPSAHVGPYLGRFGHLGNRGIIFGARLPAGTSMVAPDLSRAEIVVRLSALADDTRLHILQYVAEHGEQRSQDIMQYLGLSQSAASRHLQQLSATGYLNERRCDGAKCYALNHDRVRDTLQAVSAALGAN
jgi:DNA-binding transcriptional ArsR family regulator